MENFFVCPICGNKDQRYIGYLNGKPYCRKCISFKGEKGENYVSRPCGTKLYLSYDLSDEQKELSDRLILNYKRGKNSFVHGVCGSGKTEIVLGVIAYAIQCGEKVGFAVPRRDVAIELFERFSSILKRNSVTLVCGGNHDVLHANLVCLTCHQLYRYEKYFDLLLMDEVDAFPYKGNKTLESFFYRSLKGRYVLMSATVSKKMKSQFERDGCETLELLNRFHRHPLPQPLVFEGSKTYLNYKLIDKLKKYVKAKKQVFVFCPTIEKCERLFKFIKTFVAGGTFVHSKRENRESIIQDFKEKKYRFLVTTAVLERGVTVKDLQVMVYLADHKIYDSYSLEQIAGRAGRKKDAPEGEVIFFAEKINREIEECISNIKRSNENLQKML